MQDKSQQKPTFSSRVRQLLEEKEMTQVALARELQAFAKDRGVARDVSQSRISAWVRQPNITVTHDVLTLVADYWGVTTDFLLGRTEERHAPWMTKRSSTRKRGGGELDALAGKEEAPKPKASPRSAKRSPSSG
jgi:transcriptional regulator with XRE-family HTH domain